MHTQTENLGQLPETLRAQFGVMERRLWRVDTIIAVAGALSGLLISYMLLFVSDRLWDTPAWLRLVFTGIGIAVLAWFVSGWLKLWVLKRRDSRALANIVQRQYRRLGDRLLGIVELADEGKRPPGFSDALCRAAIAQVSNEALKYDFRLAVATRKPQLFSLAAIFLAALILAPCLLAPEASANALLRWLWPVSATPRYTFVTLSALPDKLVVAHGEPFEIQCGITQRSFVRPVEASCQYDRQPLITVPIKNNQALFRIPAQTQPGNLRLRAGDITKIIAIEPTYRPELKQMLSRVEMPAYLHYPDFEKEVRNGRVSLVEGSRVSFTGRATRALASARMGAEALQSLTVKNDTFATPPMQVMGETKISFLWQDILGLEVKAPYVLTLAAQKDHAPLVEMPELARVMAVLEDEVIKVRAVALDDYGLTNLGMKAEVATAQKPGETKTSAGEIKAGGFQEKRLDGNYDFSPLLLRAPPGSLVTLRATALDYLPGRPPSESAPHRIFIMSKEEHARLIMEEFEKIRAAIEELTRRQENLLGDTKLTKNLKPEDLKKEETTSQISEQAADQEDFAKQLERLAQDALRTAREAARNKSIPDDSIKDWMENTEIMQNIARQNMSPAASSLRNAQKSQPQRSEQLEQAAKEEQQALENLQELQKKMAAALDKMQGKSLADRLRAIGEMEKNTGADIQKKMATIIGLTMDEMPATLKKDFLRMADEQYKTSKETRKLQDEIQRFAQRTASEKHDEVQKDMEDYKVVEQVSQLGNLIEQNISGQAMEKGLAISDKFFKWAELLEDKPGGSGQGQGQGQGQQMSEEDLEKILALFRIRETEDNLREQTRLVEVYRKNTESYSQDTAKLAAKQTGLSKELSDLKEAPVLAKARVMLDHANEAMDDAASSLKRPRTDEPTLNSQADAVNLMDEGIKALMPKGSGSGQSKSQQGMMAFMQMMAMGQAKPQLNESQQTGNNPGGNAAAWNSDRPNRQFTGDASGRVGPQRTTEKMSGSGSRVLPAEFREALQSYFNAVEKAN